MDEEVPEAAQAAESFAQRGRQHASLAEAAHDVFVLQGALAEFPRQVMVPDIEDGLSAELEAALGEPGRR